MKNVVKKMMVAVVFVFLSGVALAGYQNEPDGFRGLKWGTKLKDIPGMVIVKKKGETSSGVLKNDELKLGGATLASIRYQFWQNKLMAVSLVAEGQADWEALKEVVFVKFGEGLKSNRYAEEYTWDGRKTFIILENEIAEGGSLVLMSREILTEKERYNKKIAEEGAKKGF